MDSTGSSPVYVEALERLRHFAVGFLTKSVNQGAEQVDCAGSGTLVNLDGVNGILTAAHVLTSLQEHTGQIGLLDFSHNPQKPQHLALDLTLTDNVSCGSGGPFGPNGPDIAFLALPPDTADALGTFTSFANLAFRRDEVLAKKWPTDRFIECVAGLVHERTVDLPPADDTPARLFEASFEPGTTSSRPSHLGFDLLDFLPNEDEGYKPPASYEGVSGAALV